MRSKLLPLCMAALLSGAGGLAVADDGAINNKNMTKTIQSADLQPGHRQSRKVPEAEHAFAEMMKFYVPAQAASGAPAGDAADGPIEYYNIDDVLVEELVVAKPLVNTFIYGPLFEVEATAFGHSFMDAYASVSLDDGVTWKEVNLSESADLTSFNLDTDYNPSKDDPLPEDHKILLGGERRCLARQGVRHPVRQSLHRVPRRGPDGHLSDPVLLQLP